MSEAPTAPIALSPLAHLDLGKRAAIPGTVATLTAGEVTGLAFVSLRGSSGNAAFMKAASEALGSELPATPCQSASAGGTAAYWISPDEWLITAPRPETPALIVSLADKLADIRHQVADNSGGYTLIRLRGQNALKVLSHCTVYNLDRLSAGRVVGTTFGKASVYLIGQNDGAALLVRRSFADYIWAYLERAAKPYDFAVAADHNA
jgi:sarcosine oxidase, subunit gamma